VVWQRGQAFVGQPGGGFLDFLACLAIDDAGIAVVLVAQEAQQLASRLVLFDDGVADVNSEKCIGCKKCIKACPMEAVSIE